MLSANTSISDLLQGADRIALRRAALNSEYHLMLGAGASLDSRGPGGVRLPSGKELISRLSGEFGVPAEDGDLLWRIYDRAVEKVGQHTVYHWFRHSFWNVNPPYWMEYYARAPWGTVWTLNVDDTFEAAHRRVATETTRPLTTVNWDDDYRQGRQLNVVHLHGVVDTDDPRQLVFSLAEYASTAVARAAWPVNFRDVYGNSPFVILGTRMRDEPDIEAVVSRRRPTHDAPSFYVSPSITQATKEDLCRWGLIPVEMTAEDFVLEWAELTGLDLEEDLGTEVELGLRVGQQFIELKSNRTPPPIPKHDFLGGDEPLWRDILTGLATELNWVTAAISDCRQIGKSIPPSAVLAYTGRRLSGRSTGLLLLGKHLRSASWRVFLFRKEGRIDRDAILGLASQGMSVALLFDGIADVADDVSALIDRSRAANLNIVCVGVDDKDREASILGRIHTTYLAHLRIAEINGRLTRTDAQRIVDTLRHLGRLGILEGLPNRRQVDHFSKKELFDAMAQLENAEGFGRRVGELVAGVADTKHLDLILIAAYASYVGNRLLVIDAAPMIGFESDQLIRLVQSDSQLSSLLTTDGNSLRTRHRHLPLEPLVARVGSGRASQVIAEGIRNVSHRLSLSSWRERNPTAMLLGSFMLHNKLAQAFPDADLDDWYGSLLDVFGDWNGRYWEQRAIVARRSDTSQLAKAESFALRGVALVPDAYSFTTLGTVLMEKAARASVDVEEYYERGLRAFEQAARRDLTGNSIITWIAFLRYSLKVLARLTSDDVALQDSGSLEELQVRIKEEWARVYTEIRSIADAAEGVAAELGRLRTEFEALAS